MGEMSSSYLKARYVCVYSIAVFFAWILLPASQVAAQGFGLDQRIIVSGVAFPLDDPAQSGGGNGPVQLVRTFSNVSFSSPVYLTSAKDGTDRIFVVEKRGTIKVFPNQDNVSSTTTFLDISSKVLNSGEQGFLGLAFDPNYSQNGFFYVYYSRSSPRRSVISRFSVSSNPDVANSGSEQVILQISQPYSNHNGGMIEFGPDNMLYIGLGDGGSGGDPEETGQDCTDLLGSILRINPNGGTPYSVPADNPFAGGGNHSCGDHSNVSSRVCGINGEATNQICEEVWAYGLRNPWRFSFDRTTGRLWAGDVGERAREEIDIIGSGDNLGWDIYEGTRSYENPTGRPASDFVSPIHDYDRSSTTGGKSVTGGYVYRGSNVPDLLGKYIYGDYQSGRIWMLAFSGTSFVSNTEFASLSSLASFGEDEGGDLYAVSLDGPIRRFEQEQSGGGSIPTTLSATGLFETVSSLTPTPGVIEYDVNAPLWSDRAIKKRWIALPGTQTIGFSSTQEYSFPVGTALVKHFDLDLASGATRRLETRVFFLHNQGWVGYLYKWNNAQTDADLISNSETDTFTVNNPAGGTMSQVWYYPSRSDCMNCHKSQAGRILGVRTRQLNRDFDYSGTTDNQLRSWNHIGLFSNDIEPISYDAYPEYDDLSATTEARSRAYLAVNCSICHQPGIPQSDVFDVRYGTSLAGTNLIDVSPQYGNLGLTNPARVRSGVKESSVLWERMRRLDSNRMPNLASSVVDAQAVDFIGQWIESLADTVAPAAPTGLKRLP